MTSLYNDQLSDIKSLGMTLRGGDFVTAPSETPIEEERRADFDQVYDDQNFMNENVCICIEELSNNKKYIGDIKYTQRLSYFLDGSLRTKYLGEYIEDDRSFPVLATEVISSVVKREKRDLRLEKLNRKFVFIFPHKEIGLISDTLFDKLNRLDSSWRSRNSTFYIEFLKGKPERDIRYSMQGKARDIMHKLESETANHLTPNESDWLVMDGALRKEEFTKLEYTIGLAKSFSRKPSFKLSNSTLNITRYLSQIKEGERTAIFKTKADEKICFWYIRLRTHPPMEPLEGVVKVDYVHEKNELTEEDIKLIDELSSEIYALRSPSVYPHPRWPSLIYPIRLAEEFMHTAFTNHEVIGYYGKILAKTIRGEMS